MTTVQPSNSSELQLFQVLRRANLLKYFETFISQGGDDVQQLCEAGEDEFLEIMALVGMASKPLHVRRLQKALQEWVANPAAFEELKKYPSQIMITGNKSSLSVTSEHPLDILEDVDENLCPAQSSPPLTSTPYRSQVKDTSSSDGSTFDDPNSSDSQLGDYRDTARDYLVDSFSVDQTHSGFLGMPDPRLSEHQIMAIATAASQLAKDLPPLEPKSAPKKPISQEILTVMQMSADEPHRMSALRQYAAIYGRFDSRRKNDKPMNMHEISVNEAAAQLCSHCPALLTRREELFPLARQVVRDSGYQYSKGHSRAADILLQSKLEVSDTVPSTQCLPHSAFHTVPSTPSAAIVSPELSLGVLKAELSQVKHELVEITKEQKNIRSSLRVLLESNDHDQMRKLAAKMDILNDRQTAMMNKRQKIKIAIAKCIKSSPDNCLLPDPCVQTSPVCAQFSTDSCVQTSPLCAQFSTDPCVQTSPLCAQFSTDPCVQTSPVCAQFSTDSCVQTSPVCAQFSTDSCVQTSPLCAQFSTDPCVQTSPLCAQFSTDPCVQTSPLCAQFSTDSTNNVTSSGCHGYINELESGNPLNTFNMESLPNQKDSIFEEGLRIARQYGMSDFAEQLIGLKSTTENVGSSKLSGNTPSDAGIPTLGCPSHKIASVPSASSSAAVVSLSSCAAATSSPPSLVLEYLKSGCRQYKKSHPSSSSSSLSLQTAVSPALNPVCAAEQHPLPIARTDIDPVSKNRHSSCEQEQT